MVRLLFILIFLLASSVKTGYSEKEVLRRGRIIDCDWWYTDVNTGLQPGQGWIKDNVIFENNDPNNGDWAITNPVDLPNNVTFYYLDVETKKTSCSNSKQTCSLQIFTYNETKKLRIPAYDTGITSEENKKARQIYVLNNFRYLHDITFTEVNKIEMQSFTFTYSGSKIRFGVRARGITGEFYNMTLYYYYCTETVWNGVRLPRMTAPGANESRSVVLNCTSDAVSKFNESSFKGSCWYNGTWSFPENDTGCLCRPGYEMLEMGCQRCQENHYKSKISNEDACKPCLDGSISNRANTACECTKEKYRFKNESRMNSARCYGFPSSVRDITIMREINVRGTIFLKWKRPEEDGGLPGSLKYDIDCVPDCNDQLKFTPRRMNLTQTSVTISGLMPCHKYNFTVYSKSAISEQNANWSYASKSKTYKLPDDRRNKTDEILIKLEYRIVAGIGTLLSVILIIALIYTLRRKTNKQKNCNSHDNGIDLPGETALREFGNEIDPASLSVQRSIGGENAGYKMSAKEDEHYETMSQYEAYEEPNSSPHNPDYAELNRNRRRNSENDYQKLQKLDSDYVIPAHERRESYEDIGVGRNLPDYTELDQSKRETEESQRSAYQTLS